jgi:hypothetical protein
MNMSCKQEILSFEVRRRTFEGRVDETKNNDALTSKYMPSYRYIALYRIKRDYGDGNVSVRDESRCFTTKQRASDYVSELVLAKQVSL